MTSNLAFEKAREAMLTLKVLKPNLSAQELETLELLIDDEAINTIDQSLKEADKGTFEPLDDALKN